MAISPDLIGEKQFLYQQVKLGQLVEVEPTDLARKRRYSGSKTQGTYEVTGLTPSLELSKIHNGNPVDTLVVDTESFMRGGISRRGHLRLTLLNRRPNI